MNNFTFIAEGDMNDYIFITEVDPGRSKHTSAGCRSLIRAHVMRNYWQNLKDTQQTKWCNKQLDLCSLVSSGTDTASSGNAPVELTSRKVNRVDCTKNIVSSKSAGRPRAPRVAKEKLGRGFGNMTDPFIYAGSYIDAKSYQLFRHYGSEFKVILCNRIQPIHIEGPAVSCTEAIQKHSPALLHAICYQAAAHEAVLRSIFPLRQNMFKDPTVCHGAEKDALYHKAAALANLGSLVSSTKCGSTNMETLILCVAILVAAEAIMGDRASLKSHTQGLRHLVEASGGLLALPSAVISQVQFADVKAAIAQEAVPSFALQPHLSHSVRKCAHLTTSTTNSIFSIVNFGLGFVKPSLLTRLCPALLQCIAYAKRLTLVISRTPKISGDHSVKNHDIDDFIALDHSLLSLRDHHSLRTLDECVRLALLIYSNTALWRIPCYFNWMIVLTTQLKAALMLLDWHSTIDESAELVLWVLLVGCYAARAGTVTDEDWWLDQIGVVSTKAGLTTWEDTRWAMHTFAYLDKVYGVAWEDIWNDAVSQSPPEDKTRVDKKWRAIQIEEHPCSYHATTR